MKEQNFEAKLLALDARIIEREAFFQLSIKKHEEFGVVKIIYMKIKLLKFQRTVLFKKFTHQKATELALFLNKRAILAKERMSN